MTTLSVDERAARVRELQRGRTGAGDERSIREILLATRGDELIRLKALLDCGSDHHDLHQLLFHDVDDEAIRAEILDHFAAEARAHSGTAPLGVLSDVDDTLYANWKDERYPKKTVYPGVASFYRALGGGLCFVTARPGDRIGLVEDMTLRMLAELGLIATVLCGAFGNLIGNEAIAEKKYENFREYRQVYPERRFVFTGDSGQGDVAFGRMLLEDPSSSVAGVFIHDVVRSSESVRDEHRAQRIFFFDTYAGAALAAREIGLIADDGVLAVARAARDELGAIQFESDGARRDCEADLARDLARIEGSIRAR